MKNFFIGIDFSKEKFDATLIVNENGAETVMVSHEVFSNRKAGFADCIRWMKKETDKAMPEEVLLCGEDTGRYSDAFADYFYGRGYDLWLESPLQIKRSMGIQRVKNDKADSLAIAQYAKRFEDKARLYQPESDSLLQLREIFNFRQHLVKQRKALAVRKGTVKETSLGKNDTMKFIDKTAKKHVNSLDKDIEECDRRMAELIESDEELSEIYRIVSSVKGIGLQNAAALIVVTRNFTRFGDARQLACYCGVAPFAKQSGTSIHSPAHTSPLANKQIKALLSDAARCAVRYNPVLKTYYQRMINKGKHVGIALNNVKNKLIHIIMAMVKNKTVFDPRCGYDLGVLYKTFVA